METHDGLKGLPYLYYRTDCQDGYERRSAVQFSVPFHLGQLSHEHKRVSG